MWWYVVRGVGVGYNAIAAKLQLFSGVLGGGEGQSDSVVYFVCE